MLTIKFETDKNTLEAIYANLEFCENVSGANFVFYDQNQAVGLWRLHFAGENALTDKICFLKSVQDEDKNFFVRAMLFKFQTGAPILLRIKGVHKELAVFDFLEKDGNMQIMTDKINLHKCCKD